MSIVDFGNMEDLLTATSKLTGMVICNDERLTEELRNSNQSLYVKPYAIVRQGQFPNATYVIRVTEDTDVNAFKQSLGSGSTIYLYREQEQETEPDVKEENELEGVEENELEVVVEQCEEKTEQYDVELLSTKDYSLFGEAINFEQERTKPAPVKPYEDRDFTSMSSMFAVLTKDMQIVASKDILAKLSEERPDIKASEIQKGHISATGGMVVLLSASSNIYRREARKIYPSDATLFTVPK